MSMSRPSSRSEQAIALAAEVDKDPRFVEVVLGESKRVVRHRPGLLIVEHRLGFVMANAGIDHSNVPAEDGAERVLAAAARPGRLGCPACSSTLSTPSACGSVSSSATALVGRGARAPSASRSAPPDCRRLSTCAVEPDLFGRELLVTETGFADEIAAAAGLLMGQADEALPMVLVRGLSWSAPEVPGAALVRPAEHDLFR